MRQNCGRRNHECAVRGIGLPIVAQWKSEVCKRKCVVPIIKHSERIAGVRLVTPIEVRRKSPAKYGAAAKGHLPKIRRTVQAEVECARGLNKAIGEGNSPTVNGNGP